MATSVANRTRIRRFTPIQQLFHLLLIVTFLIQGATGLARMFIETSWGKTIAWVFGGYEACRTIHIYVGILMLCGFALHGIYLIFKINWKRFPESLFSPDSLMLRPKDAKDFLQHIGWFFGISQAPQFDRWGYWEKFDYWAVFWGIPVLGITGLVMAYPLSATQVMPGWFLNLAFWIHRIEALLAMGHVFIIHFFIGHLRRHNFPMDRTMFEGSADLEATRHERPAWLSRLEQTGELDRKLVPETGVARRAVYYVVGYLALACGVFLLVGGLINSPYITW
jgi:cytochrome b subunit of formate dehydrogenase